MQEVHTLTDPDRMWDWKAHLTWLLENYPQETWEAFQTNPDGLKEAIDRKTLQSSNVLARLKARDLPEDAIQEAMLAVVAPSDGPALTADSPPEPLPPRKESRIWAWWENLPPRKITVLPDGTYRETITTE